MRSRLLVALVCCMTACGPVTPSTPPGAASDEWTAFEGTWSANGSRRTLGLGAARKASLIDVRGTMLLAGAGRPGVGFRAELIALVDSETGLIGRSVWTDERGDRLYSTVEGEGDAAHNHITGTILGGTGRYAGATGSWDFAWQSMITAEDGSIQGRAVGLKGRIHPAAPGKATPP